LNPLQSLAGVGQTSAQQVGAAGQNMTSGIGGALNAYGQGASEAMGAAAQARASGYVGGANSLTGALGQYMNYNQQQAQNERFNRLLDERERGTGYGGNYGSVGPQYGQGPLDASFDQYRSNGVTNYSDFDGGGDFGGGYGSNFGRSANAFSYSGDY
jgi:hypothetical protein